MLITVLLKFCNSMSLMSSQHCTVFTKLQYCCNIVERFCAVWNPNTFNFFYCRIVRIEHFFYFYYFSPVLLWDICKIKYHCVFFYLVPHFNIVIWQKRIVEELNNPRLEENSWLVIKKKLIKNRAILEEIKSTVCVYSFWH